VRTFTYGQSAGRSATSATDRLSDADREALEASMEEAYWRFVSVVANARQLTIEQAHERAQGRVWTGAQAHERGLVDQLGSYPEAEAWIRAACDISDPGPLPLTWVGQKPLWQRALHMLDRFSAAAPLPHFARQIWNDAEEFALLSRIGGVMTHAPALDVQ
jgi:protease-4